MNNIRDADLYSSFQKLTQIILNHINENTHFQTKNLLADLRMNGINKIFQEYFTIYQKSDEFQRFENILMSNEKYKRNFIEAVGINDWLSKLSVNLLVENIFVGYLFKNGITWKQEIIDQLYQELEKFLIDDKIKIEINTPVIGFLADKDEIKIEDEISIIKLSAQRKHAFQTGTDGIKYAYANCDLKIEFEVKKHMKKIQKQTKIILNRKEAE